MIEITKEPNADSRTAREDLTEEKLRSATNSHVLHVFEGMKMFANMLIYAGKNHDHTKLENFEEFYKALTSGEIKKSEWYEKHITEERHHLISEVPKDINLIDVIEHLVDVVMAGLSRSGEIYDHELSDHVLQTAHKNTIELLKKNVRVLESDDVLDSQI